MHALSLVQGDNIVPVSLNLYGLASLINLVNLPRCAASPSSYHSSSHSSSRCSLSLGAFNAKGRGISRQVSAKSTAERTPFRP